MSKSRKGKASRAGPVAAPPPAASAPRMPPISRRRQWAWRLLLGLFVPSAVLGLAELVLRLAGYGHPTGFFLPADEAGQVMPNDRFAQQFFNHKNPTRPFLFKMPARKTPGTIRIFLLGESAAMGTPDPAFGCGRLLELMLRQQHPGRQFEVLNVAMRGIDSHIIRHIALDCAEQEPDLLVIYAGNNEGVGLHSPNPHTPALALNLPLIRFSQGCKSSRLGQWVRAGWMLRSKREAQDMEFFRRHRRDAEDPRMARLRENFRANLRDICRAGGPGVPKVLGNVAVNLKDCPPLGSRHRPRLPPADLARWEEAYQRGMAAESAGRWAEAIGHYRAAAAVDDHFAELHYRLARCCLATQDQPGARRHFALARDWDALPFRADARLNEILRQTALELKPWNVRFADVERAFGQSEWSEAGIPGSLLFYEHVHPTFKGTYLLACALLPQVQQALGERLGPPASTPLLSLEACAAELPYTKLDEYNVAGAMAQFIGSPPFLDQLDHDQLSAVAQQTVKNLGAALTQQEIYASLAAYQAAIARRPADWPLRFNLGNLQLQLRQPQAAVEQFAWLAKAYPRIAPLRKSLGSVLANLGKYDEALVELEQAKKLDPDDAELRSVIGQLKERLGR